MQRCRAAHMHFCLLYKDGFLSMELCKIAQVCAANFIYMDFCLLYSIDRVLKKCTVCM